MYIYGEKLTALTTATDAWCDQNLSADWTDRVDEYLPVWNAKFAELIVKECIGIVENDPSWYGDYRDQIENAFRGHLVAKMLFHFELVNN